MSHLKIFVWRPAKGNVGHCALSVADRTYISWCPGGECSPSNPSTPALPHTDFHQDAKAENEEHPPTYYIKVNEEQINKIKDWWQDFKTKEKYHIIDNNCSTVVYTALKKAFPSVECFTDKIDMWVPVAIQKLAEYLVAEESNISEKVDDVARAATKEAVEIASNSKKISIEQIRKVLKIAEGLKSSKPYTVLDAEEDNPGTSKKGGKSQWDICLDVTNETRKQEEAKMLISREILPAQSQLESACIVFGRCSETFLAVCTAIAEYIRKASGKIIDVWAAYRCSEYISLNKVEIVFVVITDEGNVDVNVGDYEIYERGASVFSKESEKVLTEVEEAQKHADSFEESDLMALENCVSENANILMNKHTNLGIISPSVKKSKDFGKDSAVIYDQLCIALYVHVKGLIPIAETPFPTEIEKFPTDVLEGSFEPFHSGPYEYHDQLKMGLAIHAKALSSNGDLLVGTLGGFLDLPSVGVCGLTCAHVVLSDDEMLQLTATGRLNFSSCNKEVFQPVDYTGKAAFGHVMSAFYTEGGNGYSGMEVALFKIANRLPVNGSFPSANNYADAGFDDCNPMVYTTGKVCEVSNIRRRAEVYKYGISTEVTRGSVGLRGHVIRTTEMSGQRHTFKYRLHNQIEVLRIDVKCFAMPGDSGALVFFDDESGDSVAIGIVEGGQNNGKVFVTPICDILNSIGCSCAMKAFKAESSASPDSGISNSMDCDDTECMDTS